MQIEQQIRVRVLDETMGHHEHDGLVELSPIFQIFIYLEGQQQFYIDDVYFDLDAGDHEAPKPQALLFNLRKPANLRLKPSQAGHSLRKVGIAAQPDWYGAIGFQASALSEEVRSFMKGHLNYFIWQPDECMIDCAARILAMTDDGADEISGLQRQAEALSLMSQSCAHLQGAVQAEKPEADSQLRIKGLKVREFLLEHLEEDLSIERISKETGLSKRSIQRHFKDKYNLTVSDFIRKQRLEKARQAINKGGITVSEAAYMAGYNSPSSFSNAFKRVYGSAPKTWRT